MDSEFRLRRAIEHRLLAFAEEQDAYSATRYRERAADLAVEIIDLVREDVPTDGPEERDATDLIEPD